MTTSDVFKAYDIRGVYPTEIDEATAKAIGTGFATYLGSREIAVGHDMRVSSPSLVKAFIEGVVEQGVDVTDYGMLSTDMMYFAVASANHSGGAQITASHNPKQYNGAKLVREGAFPLSGDLGLGAEEIIIRSTGCPNGCARPYMAEIGFVGKAPGRYQLWLGGNASGTRLNQLFKDVIKEADLETELRPLLARFAKQRNASERFGDWCERVLLKEQVAAATN